MVYVTSLFSNCFVFILISLLAGTIIEIFSNYLNFVSNLENVITIDIDIKEGNSNSCSSLYLT
jgi:hypothetical protein